ncbi:hypothetical protein WI37_25535 [Burkholderia ubonensis]|nr:hypothetical protein WI37_25535 [Burkholderia ubonensis]
MLRSQATTGRVGPCQLPQPSLCFHELSQARMVAIGAFRTPIILGQSDQPIVQQRFIAVSLHTTTGTLPGDGRHLPFDIAQLIVLSARTGSQLSPQPIEGLLSQQQWSAAGRGEGHADRVIIVTVRRVIPVDFATVRQDSP